MIDAASLLQWPGMILAILGARLVNKPSQSQRYRGYELWMASNLFLVAWGIGTSNWGIVLMQSYFLYASWEGFRNNAPRRPDLP